MSAKVATTPRRAASVPLRLFLERRGGTVFLAFLGITLVLLSVLIGVRNSAGELGNQMVVGLQQGGIFALIAVGYTMVYGIIELINFAHADVFTLSAFYSIAVTRVLEGQGGLVGRLLGLPAHLGVVVIMAIVLPITMVLAGLTGVAIERVAYRPLRNAPKLAPLITAIGVSFALEGLMFAFIIPPGNAIGGNYPTGLVSTLIQGQAFSIGTVTVGWKDLFVILMAVLLMVGLQSFIRFSRLGKAMRATAQDRDAALISGIDINRTIAATFFIGTALAGAAAVIYSTYYGLIQWNLGFRLGIIAFTAAVLGGIGNIVGAGLGGFLIGMISVFGAELLGGQWADVVVFVMLILVLTIRPTGLLGLGVPDRA